MTNGVFLHRSDSPYDDVPSASYQFPARYRSAAEQCVGDWIIYLEPRRANLARGYFAVAKLSAIMPDPNVDDSFIGQIEDGTYLDFANPVPFNGPSGIVEKSILNADGKVGGRRQSAIRTIPKEDFVRIAELGLADVSVLPRTDEEATPQGFFDPGLPFNMDIPADRRIAQLLVSKPIRVRSFRKIVLDAYDERCALTGLKLINGFGRAEVEAAHIKPVEANGPDIVNNGVALSGTAHWMFDRGLLSISDDYEILMSRQINDQDAVLGLINSDRLLRIPERPQQRPHPAFLRWHRENRFKQ